MGRDPRRPGRLAPCGRAQAATPRRVETARSDRLIGPCSTYGNALRGSTRLRARDFEFLGGIPATHHVSEGELTDPSALARGIEPATPQDQRDASERDRAEHSEHPRGKG